MVVTRMTAMSLRGYCRTLSERIPYRPAIRITRLTTTASTGRRMKMSVSFIATPSSVVRRPGGRVVGWGHGVVHEDSSAAAQLEDAGGHNLRAGGDAFQHRHLIAAPAAQLHE